MRKGNKKIKSIILKSFIVIAVGIMLLTITPGEAINAQVQNNKHQQKSFPTQDYEVYCRRLLL